MRSAISTITAEISGGMSLYFIQYSISGPNFGGYVSRLLMMTRKNGN